MPQQQPFSVLKQTVFSIIPVQTILLGLLCLSFCCPTIAQNTYPKDYFKSPLRVPLYLAGNFGELRSNHFHSGLDLKTKQRTGLDVLASADGYVSRIKISLYGYGKVIYIQHPNGYTSVYGHLQEFAPKIRAYVRQRMYAQEKNTIELYPKKGELPVKQGELIALSGESGGAGGPHVHFEIRDAQQHPMNGLLFGFDIKDHRLPRINGLYVYPSDTKAQVNRSDKRQKLHLIKQAEGVYSTSPISAYGKIGFGITSVDYMDGSANTDGLYQIKTCLNGDLRFDIVFDEFSFANTRYINRYIDYAFYKAHKKRIQKLFLQPNNNIDMSVHTINKGYLDIKDSLNYKYEIVLKDYAGNKTTIIIPIKGQKLPESEVNHTTEEKTDYLAFTDKPNVFELPYHDVYIPKGALYDDTYLAIEDHPDKITVHRKTTPLHKNMTIGFDVSKYTKADRAKLYVARMYPWGSHYYSNTYRDGDRITTRTRTFGTYSLLRDDTPPQIKPVNFYDGKWMSNADYLKLKITDSESEIDSYRGTINGKFIILDYDYKTDIITYDFRDNISDSTENKLKIIVVDNVGNSTTYQATFYRKQ